MTLVNGSIKNLINGISQQSEVSRLPTQGAVQVNGHSYVVEGLGKRPPLEYIAKLKSSATTGAAIHFLDRGDATERYIGILSDNAVAVYDFTGTQKTVNYPAGAPDETLYLESADPVNDFRTVTVADHTFVVNRTITTAMKTSTFSPQNDSSALVFVKQAVNGVDYKVVLAGTTYTHTTATTGAVSTAAIADALATAIGTGPGAGYTVTRSNYVLKIKKNDGTPFTLDVEDSRAGDSLKSVQDKVQRFSDLPAVAPDGVIVKVAGDVSINEDDYFVKFSSNDTGAFGEGTWEETLAPNINYQLDSTTMPHVLVREADSTFTFKSLTWGERTAGDEDSAPNPSFVGVTLNDVFFFKNRLGLLADENVILSKAGDYYQFFPTTVTTVLDDSPIDIAATHNKVSFLRSAIPFDKKLLLFSDQTQFELEGGDTLTPKTAAITPISDYTVYKQARPEPLGDSVLFAANNGEYSILWELMSENTTLIKKASQITSHIPKFIPKNIKTITSSSTEGVNVVLTTGDPRTLYVNKFYWSGEDKVQNSWSHWTFDSDMTILDCKFFSNDLYLVVSKTNGTFLCKINISPRLTDTGMDYLTCLDFKMTEAKCTSVTYDSITNKTTFTLPYTRSGTEDTVIVTRSGGALPEGVILTITDTTTTTLKVVGNLTTQSVFIGHNYEFKYQFSTPYVRETNQNGSSTVLEGRLQLRNFSVSYENTGYFQAVVTPLYRDASTYEFIPSVLGESGFLLGEVQLDSGVFKFPVLSKNDQVTIELKNNTYRPCYFVTAEWVGQYVSRSQRI